MGITFYDPYQQQRSSENMWQNLMGNMILQKISQNFREKEFTIQREQHEQDQVQALQAEGWSEIPEPVESGPTKEGETPAKPQQSISVGGKTLYQPKEPTVKQLPGGLTAVWTKGAWHVQSGAKATAPKTVNTNAGIMRWDEQRGTYIQATDETGRPLMPHQVPRQASPYEGVVDVPVHEVDDEGNPIPGSEAIVSKRKGQPVKFEGNIRPGYAPKVDNTAVIKQKAAAKAAGLDWNKVKSGDLTPAEAQKFINQLSKADLLTTILQGQGGVPGVPAPPATNTGTLTLDEAKRLDELKNMGF